MSISPTLKAEATGSTSSAGRPDSLRSCSYWAVITVWALLTLNLCLAVAFFQSNVLAWDQWDFFQPLFDGRNWWDLFRHQHGPHRQGLAFVVTSWIMGLSHWDVRADSLWIASLLSLAGFWALRLKWKITGEVRLWDAWIPVLALTLGQFEAVLITPNASHSAFPLALTLGLANIWLQPNLWLRYLVAGFGAIALTFTGFGLFAGGVLTVLLLSAGCRHLALREYRAAIYAVVGLSLATAGWISFGSDYVFAPAVGNFRFPWNPFSDYFRFIPLMLLQPAGVPATSSVAHYAWGTLLAITILVAAAYLLWIWGRTLRPSPAVEALVLLIGAGVLFVCNTAAGRIPNGITAGMASRYVTLMFPLWLAVYGTALISGRKVLIVSVTAALWCLGLWPYADALKRPLNQWPGSLGATQDQFRFYESFTMSKAAWVDSYLKTGKPDPTLTTTFIYPWPESTHLDSKLQFMRERSLSFFDDRSFLPWLLRDRVIWNDEYPSSNRSQPIIGKVTITLVADRSGFLELPLYSGHAQRMSNLALAIKGEATERLLHIAHFPAVVTARVSPGFNSFTLSARSPSTESTQPDALWAGPVRLRTTPPRDAIVLE